MNRSWGIAAACLLLTVTGCSSGDLAQPSPAPSPPASRSTSPSPTTSSSPPTSPPASPEKITGACGILNSLDFAQITTSSTATRPREEESPETGNYSCLYENVDGTNSATRLDVLPLEKGVRVTKVIDSYLETNCKGPVTPLPGIGEKAAYCAGEYSQVNVVVGKRSHGEDRMASLWMTQHRKDVYVTLAKYLAERL